MHIVSSCLVVVAASTLAAGVASADPRAMMMQGAWLQQQQARAQQQVQRPSSPPGSLSVVQRVVPPPRVVRPTPQRAAGQGRSPRKQGKLARGQEVVAKPASGRAARGDASVIGGVLRVPGQSGASRTESSKDRADRGLIRSLTRRCRETGKCAMGRIMGALQRLWKRARARRPARTGVAHAPLFKLLHVRSDVLRRVAPGQALGLRRAGLISELEYRVVTGQLQLPRTATEAGQVK